MKIVEVYGKYLFNNIDVRNKENVLFFLIKQTNLAVE